MRMRYEMSDKQLDELLDNCKPVVMMKIGSYTPRTPQENANAAWCRLGDVMGFDGMTVEPVHGKGTKHFTAMQNSTRE